MEHWGILFFEAVQIVNRKGIEEPTTEEMQHWKSKDLAMFIAVHRED